MSRKTQETYNYLFCHLLEVFTELFGITVNDINWEEISMDYESGLILAIEKLSNKNFPRGLSIDGCHFHHCSALWKNLLTCGLSVQYRDETTGLKLFMKKLFALPFLRVNEVRDMFQYLQEHEYPVGLDPNDENMSSF